ncbi:retrovirus-related pol polyprotein from transposon TNT 1-94, partial [Tanacetum coccineum]
SDVSYYIIPHGHSLTEITQENHVPNVIAPNEPEIPHTEDDEGLLDLINTEGTHEQNVQNDQMITQPTDVPSENNTEVLRSITEPLVIDVSLSHITNQASISFHPVPQDRWSRDQHIELVNIIGNHCNGMLTRSMATKLTTASASKCLFADFLSEIEPKKVSEALKHPGWIDAMQEEQNMDSCSSPLWKNSYSQEEGIVYDETFAPMAKMEAIRIFLAFATYMNFKVYQINVKSAFLNGKLKEEVYVKQPPDFESSEFPDYVCKLDKALYRLKQAPRACPMCKISVQSKGITSNSCFDLKGYSDSDYAGCNMDKKSTSGACQILGGKLVCWSAKKQQSVAMSSAEAEYVAAAGCCESYEERIGQNCHQPELPGQNPSPEKLFSCGLKNSVHFCDLGSDYTQDKKFGFLPPILSNSNFIKDPSKVIDIELKAHMITINNRRDSVSPPPLAPKLKKGKS